MKKIEKTEEMIVADFLKNFSKEPKWVVDKVLPLAQSYYKFMQGVFEEGGEGSEIERIELYKKLIEFVKANKEKSKIDLEVTVHCKVGRENLKSDNAKKVLARGSILKLAEKGFSLPDDASSFTFYARPVAILENGEKSGLLSRAGRMFEYKVLIGDADKIIKKYPEYEDDSHIIFTTMEELESAKLVKIKHDAKYDLN